MRKSISLLKVFMVLSAIGGIGTGASAAATAQSWPNQCWNDDGGPSCPVCGGGCMGGDYLCCNNASEQ